MVHFEVLPLNFPQGSGQNKNSLKVRPQTFPDRMKRESLLRSSV
jgi:hypothetical protein